MKRRSALVAFASLLFCLATNAAERTVTLSVPSMYCETCPITVSKALKRVKGVATVKASYQTKEAVVTFDDTSTSLEALQNATANAGYPSALKK
jgi:mercuric ion binding protein